jgi:dGTP triphosphohydrolase
MDAFIRILEQLVTLIAAFAWPATVILAVVYLKKPIESLLEALASRIKDPRSNVTIGKEGLEIKSRLESLEIDQEQTKSLTLQALGVSDNLSYEVRPSSEALDPELIALANEYMAIQHSDWAQRVRLKDAAARKMADLVITKNISRETLARQHHEGLILALAAASHTVPREGDVEHLLHVADEVSRLHVKYRIVLALGRLFERGIAKKDQVEPVCEVLRAYKHGADRSLSNRISYSENVIRSFGGA